MAGDPCLAMSLFLKDSNHEILVVSRSSYSNSPIQFTFMQASNVSLEHALHLPRSPYQRRASAVDDLTECSVLTTYGRQRINISQITVTAKGLFRLERHHQVD